MAAKRRIGAGWVLLWVVALAGVLAMGWWAGRGQYGALEGAVDGARNDRSSAGPQASSKGPGALAAASAGQPDPFDILSCQARQHHDALAIAVTFTQPVDARARLDGFLRVADAGAPDDEGRAAPPAPLGESYAPPPSEPGEPSEARLVDGGWSVGENPRVVYFPYVQAQRRYEITAQAGLPAASGESLPAMRRCVAETDAMAPSFFFASRGSVLPSGQNGGLPVVTVNVPEVDVQFLRIAPEKMPAFFETVLGVGRAAREDGEDGDSDDAWRWSSNRSMKGLVGLYDLDRLHELATSAYQGRFLTDDGADRRRVTFLPVEDIAALGEPGIYVAVMSEPGRFRYEYQVSYFYVSDIGLHARRYGDRLDAYAVSLTTGRPLPDVDVELLDSRAKPLARARSDAGGRVSLTGVRANTGVLRAQRGKEMTVLALGEPGLDLSEFDVAGHPSRPNSLFVYAGRNLYRPGEGFEVSVLPRDADGRPLPPVPLTAELKRPDGKLVQSRLWEMDPQVPGYMQHKIELPQDAATGAWTLALRVDPASRAPDASWRFQVEEFLPERMKLALETTQAVLGPKEPWRVAVQGDYLYGAPAQGNRLLSSLQVRRARQALPAQWPGFVFGDVADDATLRYEELPETRLDGDGRAALEIEPGVDGAKSPMALRMSASLLESGGRPVVRSIERTVWPADRLIAVRPRFDRDVTRESSPAEFEAVRVDAGGKVVPLAAAHLRLFHEERRYYWRYDDQRGWNSGYTDLDELVESRQLALNDRVRFSLPVRWGRYRLELADPETGQTLRYRFYAGWNAQNADEVGNRPDRVQMRLSGVPAKPGGTVGVTVSPPHDGVALVTVEGDQVLWRQWVDVKASGTSLEIPLDPSWARHDLYVSAVVFRPGAEGAQVTPARAVGLAYLPLDTGERRLEVALDAPAQVRPERRTTVQVQVRGIQGGADAAQAHVTLSAVDVGILDINQYPSPDPEDFFFGKHRYGPELLDMYGRLIEKMDGTRGRLKWGGDASMRGDTRSMPRKVRLVDLFSGPVALDAQGRARIPLDLPDFNGTLRLMAVAFTDTQYGHADTEMVAAAPIVAELSLPRFLSPGDRAAVALDLTNMTASTQQVEVELQAFEPLSIAEGTRTLTLAPRQRSVLRFEALAGSSYGEARIRLGVRAQGGPEPLDIVRESALTVQPAFAPERRVKRLRIAPGQAQTVPASWLAGWQRESATLSLAVSSSPPLNPGKQVRDLLAYPYGCTEQTISATLPYVLMDEELASLAGLPLPSRQAREAHVEGALARLAGMRNSAGAYSLWGDGSRDLWVSAYAQAFMLEARDQGFTVPEPMLARTRDWLLEQLRQAPNRFGALPASARDGLATGKIEPGDGELLRNDHQRFAELAAAALPLAREGRAPLATLRVLYDQYQDRSRSLLPLVQLAVAFRMAGDEGRARAAVDAAMRRPYGFGGDSERWLGDYGSPVRDYALAYALMTQHGLEHPGRENLLAEVAVRLDDRSHLSTQEQMAVLRAARAAGAKRGQPWSVHISRPEGEPILRQSAVDEVLALDAGWMQGELTLRNTGAQPVFAEIDAQGYPGQAPAQRNDVIALQKTWYHPDGRLWNGMPLRTGDLMVVRIQAQARQRIVDGLVVDRIPAGLEVENLALVQGPQMDDWTLGGRSVRDALSDPRIKHTEYRDDRYVAAVELTQDKLDLFYRVRVVAPGRYVVPATQAEDMYRPELRGVGESWGTLDVRDRAPDGG